MTRKYLILLATAGSALTLAGAYFFQHVVGILPCHLCLLQRWPHAIMVLIGLVALAVPGRLLPLAGGITALVSTGLAIYHSGVERKLWAGPASCTGGEDLSGLSGADLLSTELASPIVQCDQISFQILGLTFANMNIAGSLLFAILWLLAARKS
jgi:disulfide bond formation protein DsbB